MLSKKKIDDAWRNIKIMLKELNCEITSDLKGPEGKFAGYAIKYGAHQVLIVHLPDMSYMNVSFRIDFDDEPIKKMKELQNSGDWNKFLFSFKTQISSSLTGNNFKTDKEGTIIGYEIVKRIFPFHTGFSIEKLYIAIQAVVSVGFKGIIFLSPIFGKELEVETTLESPPDVMYR